MKLHNTLTRKTEEFKPLKHDEVKLYTCGPTVYDFTHIGNLRSFIFDDTLRRVLEASNFKVNHVMNITDVGHLVSDEDEGEDKLEKGAKREGRTVWDVAQYYTDAFIKDMKALNILPPNGNHGHYARATDFINEQIDIVKRLLDKGLAYITKQAIYFDVTKLPDYGKLSGQKLVDKEVGAREEVVTDKNKHHPYDFAVWFFTVGRFKDHSMKWDSPWGNGFPGWHLECSAIIHATLGEPIDIHTGGVDHIGTHHTNEIAQTEGAFDKPLANYWLHNEYLLVGGKKMSKSLGNFHTLQEIIGKGYDPLAFRLMMLQSHYRSQANFTWEGLEAAQNRLKLIYQFADLKHQILEGRHNYDDSLNKDTILSAMADDLNSPLGLSFFSGYISIVLDNLVFESNKTQYLEMVELAESLFGLSLSDRPNISDEQRELIKQREQAREEKNFAKSDELRAELEKQNIGLRDTDYGAIWYRL